jgi:hypothetical protein
MTQDFEAIASQVPVESNRLSGSDLLRKLGYQVEDQQDKLGVKRQNISYTVLYSGQVDDKFVPIPVNCVDAGTHIFNTDADCLAVRQGKKLYQFKIGDLRDFLHDVVRGMEREGRFAYGRRQNALDMKRLHVVRNDETDGLDIIMYVNIDALCTKIKKHIVQDIS